MVLLTTMHYIIPCRTHIKPFFAFSCAAMESEGPGPAQAWQQAVSGNFIGAPRPELQPVAVSLFHQGIPHLELRESRKVPVGRP